MLRRTTLVLVTPVIDNVTLLPPDVVIALLLKEDGLPLFRNVSPVHSVQILALFIITKVSATTLGEFLDFQCGLITDSGVVGIRAHDDKLPINVFRPRVVWAAASKALVGARTACRVSADFGSVVTVFSKCLLGN